MSSGAPRLAYIPKQCRLPNGSGKIKGGGSSPLLPPDFSRADKPDDFVKTSPCTSDPSSVYSIQIPENPSTDQRSDRLASRSTVSEQELADLDAKTRTMEEQMHHLSQCLEKLSHEFATDQKTSTLLRSHVTTATNQLATAKGQDVSRDTLLKQKQKMNENCWDRWNSKLQTSHQETPLIEQLLKENKEVLALLEEERLSKIELRAQYEQQLNWLRHIAQKSKMDERRKVLRELDYVIRKYHALAEEAAHLARRERTRTKDEKLRVQRVAEAACKGFEKDLKEKTKVALDQYRKLAHEAHNAAKREREELSEYCQKMESAIDKERRTFEAHVIREAEKRVASYRRSCAVVQQQMERDRTQFQDAVNDMCDTIETKCQQFEESMYSKVLQILWENGVDMNEETLTKRLREVPGVPLRSTIEERARQEAEMQLLRSRVMKADTSKYGIFPLKQSQNVESDASAEAHKEDDVTVKEGGKTVRFQVQDEAVSEIPSSATS